MNLYATPGGGGGRWRLPIRGSGFTVCPQERRIPSTLRYIGTLGKNVRSGTQFVKGVCISCQGHVLSGDDGVDLIGGKIWGWLGGGV